MLVVDWSKTLPVAASVTTAVIAIISLMTVVRVQLRLVKKALTASSLKVISDLLGTFEGMGELRGDIKNALLLDDRLGVRCLAEAIQLDSEIALKVDKVSAAFDRAAWALAGLRPDESVMRHFLNEFGDIYTEYWVLCFERTTEQQNLGNDLDNRLYFEYLAYLAYDHLCDTARRPTLLRFFEGNTPIAQRRSARAARLKYLCSF